MKIAVIGASGKQGKMLAEEALRRGHEVTAVVRNKAKLNGFSGKVIEKDILALTYEDVKDNDAVINAFGTGAADDPVLHQTVMAHMIDIFSGKPNRLLVVGGASTLFVDKEHKVRLLDTPEFPDVWKPVAGSMAKAFEMLKTHNDVNWTFFSPAAFFIADGKRTGSYILGEDELILNSQGKSEISYADYATAMVDEVEKGNYIRKRFTAVAG
ncbi:NAD(P)-dependent oxidoreductase [Seleniivibrio woodruffii]|uniref:NAD(P)-dependent oxidoreductase n=1 Tax=Seleniivibrio woodruffii TaxID=1078050 RepID=UPI0026F0E260|nr:NAD(P)-dependent oxidoreductase [Seleniivibrio woodruffii]